MAAADEVGDEAISGNMLPHVAAGVAGRVAAETFKSPFDLLKVRLQYDTSLKSRSLPVALFTVIREDGLRAWRGLPPRLIWSAPLAGATFTYYQVLKSETGGNDKLERGFSLKTVVGGPAVLALSVALRTPFDIIEQQLQLSSSKPTASGMASPSQPSPFSPTPEAIYKRIHETWKTEGARGVWRGYPAALGGITTYAAVLRDHACAVCIRLLMKILVPCRYVAGYFVIYEAARRSLENFATDLVTAYPTVSHLVSGGLGGGLTAMLATPFDCIKVRMQTKVYATAADPHPSMMLVTRETVKAAGWMGLLRGATARGISNAPSGAIMFAVYEAGYRWVDKKFRKIGLYESNEPANRFLA